MFDIPWWRFAPLSGCARLTDTKKKRKTEATLHLLTAVLGKPMTEDIMTRQPHAIA